MRERRPYGQRLEIHAVSTDYGSKPLPSLATMTCEGVVTEVYILMIDVLVVHDEVFHDACN